IVCARIDQHHARDVRLISGRIKTNQPTPVRMAHENERRRNTTLLEPRVQLVNNLTQGARVGTQITPSVTGPIIRADASELRNARLYETPLDREVAEPPFE